MEEEPAPTILYKLFDVNQINLKNKYIFKAHKSIYKLILYYDNSFIYFKIIELNNITFYYYQNKYSYESLIQILELDANLFINLEIIEDLIYQTYINKYLNLKFDIDNNAYFSIKLYKDDKLKKYKLPLKKETFGINEKFHIIIEEINKLRKGKVMDNKEYKKLYEILKYLEESIFKKLDKNKSKINLLNSKLNDNEKILNQNKENILFLNNQIKIIQTILFLNKNNDKNNNINLNKNKLDINKENEVKNKINSSKEELKFEKLNENNLEYSLLIKIILIGDSFSGKTWIIDSFITYPSISLGTTGIEKKIKYIKINDEVIKLSITDCPGLDKYYKIWEMNCEDKDLIMFVYAIDDLNSFNAIKKRIKSVKRICNKKSNFILIGTKADLEDNRKISYEEGEELANKEKLDLFIEVSSKNSFNIDELFFESIKIVCKNKKN